MSKMARYVSEDPETLKIESTPDENEFKCFKENHFSQNFQLPRRKICPCASHPCPGRPGYLIVTELIENTGQPGDLCEHFLFEGQRRKLNFQVQVYLIKKDSQKPDWTEDEVKKRFVYNSFDPEEKIDYTKPSIWFFDSRDVNMFQLTIHNQKKVFLTLRDLQEMKFPEGSTNHQFIDQNLAIYKDAEGKSFLHNPTKDEAIGSIDVEALGNMCNTTSLLIHKPYPGKILFIKRWNQNQIYSITIDDFIQGNFENFEKVNELKFPKEIEVDNLGGSSIFSFEDRLIMRNWNDGLNATRFFDTTGKTVVMKKPENGFKKFINCLTVIQQGPQDAISKKAANKIQNGHLDYITAFDMSTGKTYMQHSIANVNERGIYTSAKIFCPYSKRMTEVSYYFEGMIEEIERKDNKNIYHRLILNQGRKIAYNRNMFYMSIFADQIHQFDCLTKQIKIYPLKSSQKVLSAVKYAQNIKAFQKADHEFGMLIHDSENDQLIVKATTATSKDLEKEYQFPVSLKNGIPRDTYQVAIIKFPLVTYFIFQRKNEIKTVELRDGKVKTYRKEALPLDMHADKQYLFTVRKTNRGSYQVVRTSYFNQGLPETILGTDQNEIIATCSISLDESTRIATLNSERQIRIYEIGKKVQKLYVNISSDSFKFSVPLLFPQFYLNDKDLSVIFNGRDYCAYTSKEEAELRKAIEDEVFDQFKVDTKDFQSQFLAESPRFNSYISQKLLFADQSQELVDQLMVERNKGTYIGDNNADKIVKEKKTRNFNFDAVPIINFGIKRTEKLSIKRGLNQKIFTVNLGSEVQGLKFDQYAEVFLVLVDNNLLVYDNLLKFLKKVELQDLISDQPIQVQITKSSFTKAEGCKIKLSNSDEEEFLIDIDILNLNHVEVNSLDKYEEDNLPQQNLQILKGLLENKNEEVVSYHKVDEERYIVEIKELKSEQTYVTLQEKVKDDQIIERKRLAIENEVSEFQDLGVYGVLIHTKDHIIEFFTQAEAFKVIDFQEQISKTVSNTEKTMLVAQDKLEKNNLIVMLSNTKEYKVYCDSLRQEEPQNFVIQGLKKEMLTQINPDTLGNLFQAVGLRKVEQLHLINELLQSLRETGDEKTYIDAVKMIFYPLREEEMLQTKAWDSFSLAILKDFKGAGEIFLQNIANLFAAGEEINSLVFKDLDFFEKLLPYNSFPEVLDSIQGQQQAVEVFNSWVPEEGISFLSKKPHITDEIIEQRMGEIEGKGLKKVLYMRKIQFDFLKKDKVLGDFCDLLDHVTDDKILGNETLEIVIDEIWRKTQPKILKYIFLPYIIYFTSFIIYISFFFDPYNKLDTLDYIVLTSCLIYSIILILMEFWQMIREGKEYYASVGVVWNFIDITSSAFVSYFILANLFDQDANKSTYIIGGLGVFFLWLKLFYFMRMFQETAAFVRMIIEMFLDIKIFLFIFFIGILAFSNCFYVLDMYTRLDKDDQGGKSYDSIAGNSYMESFRYVYLQSLGELGFDGYDSSYSPSFYWAFFFASSLFLQITLLNLLIAIMGDTFDRIQEVQREAKTKERCSILSEYAYLIPQKSIINNCCIYVASYENKDEVGGQSGWEGKLATLKSFFQKSLDKLNKSLEKSTERLESKNNQSRKAVQSQIEQIQSSIAQVRNDMETKEEKQDKVKQHLLRFLEENKLKQEQSEKERQELKEQNQAQAELLKELKTLLRKYNNDEEKVEEEQEKEEEKKEEEHKEGGEGGQPENEAAADEASQDSD